MSKQEKQMRYIKGTVLLVIIFFAFCWFYYSYYTGPPSSSTNTSATHPISVTTSFISLQQSDFNITVGNGCVFVNKTTGQLYVRFSLQVTNRFNEKVQYISGSATVFLLQSNPNRQVGFLNFSNPHLLPTPTYTNALPLFIAFPLNSGDRTTFNAALSLHLIIWQGDKNQEILLMKEIPVKADAAYATC
jgi:hypothetical protein